MARVARHPDGISVLPDEFRGHYHHHQEDDDHEDGVKKQTESDGCKNLDLVVMATNRPERESDVGALAAGAGVLGGVVQQRGPGDQRRAPQSEQPQPGQRDPVRQAALVHRGRSATGLRAGGRPLEQLGPEPARLAALRLHMQHPQGQVGGGGWGGGED